MTPARTMVHVNTVLHKALNLHIKSFMGILWAHTDAKVSIGLIPVETDYTVYVNIFTVDKFSGIFAS